MQVPTFPGKLRIPDADPEWHPIAIAWYDSLADSGQSQFYEPSDYAVAYIVGEAIHQMCERGDFSAVKLATVLSGMNDLLCTEGSRRRMRVELQKPEADSGPAPEVTAMAQYRKATAG